MRKASEPVTVDYIKQYRPESNSLGSGQVLHRPYKYEEAKIIVREMADGIHYSLESVTKYVRYSTEKNKWVKFNSVAEAKELYVFKQKGYTTIQKMGMNL